MLFALGTAVIIVATLVDLVLMVTQIPNYKVGLLISLVPIGIGFTIQMLALYRIRPSRKKLPPWLD